MQFEHMNLVRKGIFGVVSVFSLIVMSLSAHLIDDGSGKAYIILALVVSILSLLSFPIILITDEKRKGFFTSKIQFELFWTGFFAILWLVSAAYTSDQQFRSWWYRDEMRAMMAFSHMNWIFLFFYFGGLATLSLNSFHGGNVWKMSVEEADFGMANISLPTDVSEIQRPQQLCSNCRQQLHRQLEACG